MVIDCPIFARSVIVTAMINNVMAMWTMCINGHKRRSPGQAAMAPAPETGFEGEILIVWADQKWADLHIIHKVGLPLKQLGANNYNT